MSVIILIELYLNLKYAAIVNKKKIASRDRWKKESQFLTNHVFVFNIFTWLYPFLYWLLFFLFNYICSLNRYFDHCKRESIIWNRYFYTRSKITFHCIIHSFPAKSMVLLIMILRMVNVKVSDAWGFIWIEILIFVITVIIITTSWWGR